MRTDILKKRVIAEATLLKANALPEELAKLNFAELDGSNKTKCIYGQMTNHCESRRATELIEQCCERVYNKANWFSECELNGKPTTSSRYHYFSPIEVLIGIEEIQSRSKKTGKINQKRLIAFLTGKTKKLNLK